MPADDAAPLRYYADPEYSKECKKRNAFNKRNVPAMCKSTPTPPPPGVFGYLMEILGYLMGVLGYLMGVLGYPMAWRRR